MNSPITLVFLLEEPSAKEMLQAVCFKLFSDAIDVKYIVFEGKQDLEKQLERKIKCFQVPNSKFVVLRDKDSADCKALKAKLQAKVHETGRAQDTLIRIACTELESFFLGDLNAIKQGLNISHLAQNQSQKIFKNPDNLNNAKQELDKIVEKHLARPYGEIKDSRAIAPYLDLDNNTSVSFNVLIAGLKKLVA